MKDKEQESSPLLALARIIQEDVIVNAPLAPEFYKKYNKTEQVNFVSGVLKKKNNERNHNPQSSIENLKERT